ncbi:sensor histidine kinase [Clostridium aciditolerans]|uniref:GHKL domain-containing protein n=1 Tax=Clostridium aciditolerans TaxID=339861 RepID=A0A934M630_9CLOT|nr:GHKL domain-containing protein [Clostridium aciditolerans]MBI6874168.1 GHKL domain-containing protein [Clostridium aciditolerans]
MFDLIFEILYPLILALSITSITVNISPDKQERRSIVIFTVVNYFMTIFIHIYRKDIILEVAVIFNIFLYLYIASKRIWRSIVIALCANIIFAASDAIVGFIDINILNFTYSQVISNLKIYFATGLLILLISHFLSKIIRMIYNRIYTEGSNIKEYLKENLIAILYIVSGLFIVNVHLIMYKSLVKSIGRVNTFLNMILIIEFIGMSVLLIHSSSKNIKNKLRQEYKEKEYQQLKEYTDRIEDMDSDLRRFKHDYINILQTLGGYIETGDIDGLKEFYHNDLLKESNKIIDKDRYLSILKHIKIDALKALISSKIINAYSYGIEIQIEIIDDIHELSINTIDICRIIGIFIDNAIEAAILCDKKDVKIAVVKNDDSTVFIISNSCLEDTPPIYKIYEENFSTKGDNRGIGLKTVRYIVNEKYDNVILNTKIKDCVFKQELIIYDLKA